MVDPKLSPLTAQLSSYAHLAQAGQDPHYPKGSAHFHRIPRVCEMIRSRGYVVWNADSALEFFIRAVAKAPNLETQVLLLDLMAHIAERFPQVGAFTGHSSNTALVPNHVLFCCENMAPDTQFVIHVHELAHVLTDKHAAALIEKTKQEDPMGSGVLSRKGSTALMECLAYGVQYIVQRHFGIDSDKHIVRNMSKYAISAEMVEANQEEILAVAQEVIQWLDARD